ncbi:MAG: YbhB/YbcL family Raf kinase inhibitor-like protein [Planctomycetota bacterium]
MSLHLESPAFTPGEHLPQHYAHAPVGDDISPPLRWSKAPEGTRSFALICDDPDAPMEQPFVHWLLYGIPPQEQRLTEGDGPRFKQGRNDFDQLGWGGPLPPEGHGVHRYYFRLFALDTEIDLGNGASKDELMAAMEGHIIDKAETVGCFERRRQEQEVEE